MISKFLFFLLFFLFTPFLWGKSSVLNRIISVEVNSIPVRTILTVIEQRAEVQFSYNPDLIDENKIVSLSIQKKTVAFGLSLIFNKNVRFKEVGSHIILLKNENSAELKRRKKSNTIIVFSGKITDKRTGKPIKGASIYDVDARNAVISKTNGKYELQISNFETIRSLYFRKKGYKEVVVVVDVSSKTDITRNIALEPMQKEIQKIEQTVLSGIDIPLEERVLSGELVSYETYIHIENLEDIKESRIAQISLVPSVGIGSNLSTNGLITNNISLNIISGYSSGVMGVEVGGILNIVNGNVKWCQIGGIYNIVGGNVQGVQVGGIINSVKGNFYGVQIGGIKTKIGGDFIGVQVGGISGRTNQNFNGIQLSGIKSTTVGKINGTQISGIFSVAQSGFNGFQLSGIIGVTDSLSTGVQLSGISSQSYGRLNGGQISGISNFSKAGINKIQLSAISNFSAINEGLQLGGVFNYAKTNNGLQIGLINSSKNGNGNGIAIGLINYVVEGYHKFEISSNEIFQLNATLKSGNRKFYNTYSYGIRLDTVNTFTGGLGFGTNFELNEKWQLNADISANIIYRNNNTGQFKFNWLYKFSPTIGYNIANWTTFFVGPIFNINLLPFSDDGSISASDLSPYAFYDKSFSFGRTKMWVGGQIGFRF